MRRRVEIRIVAETVQGETKNFATFVHHRMSKARNPEQLEKVGEPRFVLFTAGVIARHVVLIDFGHQLAIVEIKAGRMASGRGAKRMGSRAAGPRGFSRSEWGKRIRGFDDFASGVFVVKFAGECAMIDET